MRHATCIATFLGMVCALPAASQSITVTKPVAGGTCTKGQACAIAWTVTGQPGSTGIIELLEETTTNVVRVIKPDVQIANLQYSWTVPGDFAAGKYRVRVRVAWLVVSAPGGVFTIQAQSGGNQTPPGQPGGLHVGTGHGKEKATAPAAVSQSGALARRINPVKILYPSSFGATWEPGKKYTINWTSDTHPAGGMSDGFFVDLCDSAGGKVRGLFSGVAQQRPDGSWYTIAGLACNDREGVYTIRVTSMLVDKSALSGKITAVIPTKKLIKSIPIQVQNAVLTWTNSRSFPARDCEGASGKRVRVGFDYAEYNANYGNHAFRSRLTFDLSEFHGKKGEVESATLILGDRNTCPRSAKPFCAAQLFALSAAEVGSWNVMSGPPPKKLTGWWADARIPAGIDITVPVREWITGARPNKGFVITGLNEANMGWLGDHDLLCYSHAFPIMYVTFIEKPPCGSQ